MGRQRTGGAYMLVSLLLLLLAACVCADKYGKIMNEYTMKKPFSDHFQHWKLTGATEVQTNKIMFLPTSRKMSATMWTNEPNKLRSWEVILEFGVHGIAPLSTGEGMAFWHVSEPSNDGPVYGHSDQFNGLGVFFDSYDSNGNGEAESYVLAMYNDGTKPIDAEGAGIQLGVCFADYRNLPHPARAKITYDPDTEGGKLLVGLDIDNSGKFSSCLDVKQLKLRPGVEHFGLTVSDYANDFEVFSFTAIDTAAGYTSSSDPSIMQVDGDDSKSGFESHAHFQRLIHRLDNLHERLVSLGDQFSRQFQAVFNNHNRALDYHVSKLQTDLGGKHAENDVTLASVASTIDNMQRTIGGVVASLEGVGGGGSGSEKELQSLTQIKVACATDNHRGSTMVAQLSESVITLQDKQQAILSEVHNNLDNIRVDLQDGCGAGSLFPVLAALVGVVVGTLVTPMFVKDQRSHLP